jgi:hypothetical protein
LAIRRSGEPENHRARHFILWDLQGIAMVNMYAGDALAARQAFQDLLNQINAAQGEMTKKQLLELEDRRPNLYERLADTALLTGSESLDGMSINPAEELESAIQFAESLAFAEDGRKAVLIRLEYKLAAVRAMRGEQELALERRNEAVAYEKEASASSPTSSAGGRRATYELTKQIAQSVLKWKSEDRGASGEGRGELLALVETAPSNLDRDDLFLLLYVAENLIKSKELSAGEEETLAQAIHNLVPVKSSSGPAAQGVFARYLEMAQAARQE